MEKTHELKLPKPFESVENKRSSLRGVHRGSATYQVETLALSPSARPLFENVVGLRTKCKTKIAYYEEVVKEFKEEVAEAIASARPEPKAPTWSKVALNSAIGGAISTYSLSKGHTNKKVIVGAIKPLIIARVVGYGILVGFEHYLKKTPTPKEFIELDALVSEVACDLDFHKTIRLRNFPKFQRRGDLLNAACIRMPSGGALILVQPAVLKLDASEQRALLGHELAHAIRNDAGRRMALLMLTPLLSLPIKLAFKGRGVKSAIIGGVAIEGVRLAVMLGMRAYSRHQEKACDSVAQVLPESDIEGLLEKLYAQPLMQKIAPKRALWFGLEDLLYTHPTRLHRLKNLVN